MVCLLTLAALVGVLNIAAGKTGFALYACLAQLKTSTIFGFTAPHKVTYMVNTATFFTIHFFLLLTCWAVHNKACLAHRQFVLTSPFAA